VDNTDVKAPNPGFKSKLKKNCKVVPQSLLVVWNVVPGSTKMLIQEHVVLDEIPFTDQGRVVNANEMLHLSHDNDNMANFGCIKNLLFFTVM